jgi:hypothetical protein
MNSSLRAFIKTTLSSIALGGVICVGSLLPQQVKAQTSYEPAYTTNPATALGANTATNTPSSFGFFFDVQGNAQVLDGLGFSAQSAWGNGTSYVVTLWSYANAGTVPGDYTQIATKTFTHGSAYTLQNGYWWQSLAPLLLPDTYTTDPTDQLGYVISVVGDFSNATGNVQYETNITSNFNPSILNAGNGFNDANDTSGPPPFYPIPAGFDPAVGTQGYFNPNMSFAPAPGPLPMIGAAAGFAWSRRLRKRIQTTK